MNFSKILAEAGARVEPVNADRLPILDVLLSAGTEALTGRTTAEMFKFYVWPAESLGTIAAQLSCETCSEMAQAVVAYLQSLGWFLREYDAQLRWFPPEADPDKWVSKVRAAAAAKRAAKEKDVTHDNSSESTAIY